MIGRTLSHYKILSEISRGGMGIVYRAVDVKLDREVALKVLPPELVADSERKRRFVQEAKAAAKLEHPHIGVVYEIDEVDGVSFIAMELIRGEQLRDTIAKGPLPLRRALEIATDIAEGLAKAHEEGIVHRDMKPANVMVTEDGHTKIIDFGLAKLVEPLAGEGSDVETLTRGETDAGKVMGTAAYMSPEQARGQKVDHRTDIFSFGILFYEMLTGEPPFKAPSSPETLSAIINAPTPSLSSTVTGDVAPEIERIVNKCLEKDSAERYQGMKDLIVDLRAARRRLESGSVAPVASSSRGKPWLYIGMGAAAALILVAVLLLFRSPTREETPLPPSKPSIAVLFFDNVTDDPELEWLRMGLTDMLVTDLSQSPNLSVLSTDHLYQILSDMNRLDERITSLELVQEIAERSNSQTVILGSFIKAGETIRINLRIQDAPSGRILTTEKVEGIGQDRIFPMVDDLTRRIKANFEMSPAAADADFDIDLRDVTTSSVEAYRLFTEGRRQELQTSYNDAIPLYKKAVAIDPNFAIAHARLAAAHLSTGRVKEAEDYALKAFQQADRLPERERYYVEGYYYAFEVETFERTLQIYEELLERYPDYHSARQILANRYRELERYDEAIEHFEELSRRGYSFVRVPAFLAGCYARKGLYEKGYQLLQDELAQNPDNYFNHLDLGSLLADWGKLDEALESFRRAEQLEDDSWRIPLARSRVHILQDNWEQVESDAQKLTAFGVPFAKWFLALKSLYQGRSREGLAIFDQIARSFEEYGMPTLPISNATTYILLEQGQAALALEQAEKAQREDQVGLLVHWRQGLFLAARAQARLGRWEEAERTADELERKAELLPTEKYKRSIQLLVGEIALERGDSSRAVVALENARSTLPLGVYHGLPFAPRHEHVPIWFFLARAYMESGDEEQAAERFQRIIESKAERVAWPIPYVRSFYFLGKIHENRGEMDKAREYYRRFYEYWKDGDMDRERVEEARKKLAS